MNRYWRGTTKDGKFVSEALGAEWKEVAKELTSLEFVNELQVIKLPDNMEYIQAKTASADLCGGGITIESRYIGFLHKGTKFIVRADENNGDIKIEIGH